MKLTHFGELLAQQIAARTNIYTTVEEPLAELSAPMRFEARPLEIVITVMATVGRCCVVLADIETAIISKHVYRISVEPRLINLRLLAAAWLACAAQRRASLKAVPWADRQPWRCL